MSSETIVSNMQNQLGNLRARSNAGPADQWKMHLEEAYFNSRQSAGKASSSHTQSHGDTVDTADTSANVSSPADTVIKNTPSGDVAKGSPPQSQYMKPSMSRLAPGMVDGKSERITLMLEQTLSTESRTTFSGQERMGRTTSSSINNSRNQLDGSFTLPQRTSVKVISLSEGVQVIVRDTSLNGEAKLHLVSSIRRLFEQKERPLFSIIINGDTAWQELQHKWAGHHADMVADADFTAVKKESRINKIY